jgi:hypothetical protein
METLLKKRGRPRNLELVTIDQAIEIIQARLMEKYNNPVVVDRMCITKKTIYNKISLKELTKYGTPRCTLLDVAEVEAKLVG